jgi:GNAT superfamily N-acetyltransferase
MEIVMARPRWPAGSRRPRAAAMTRVRDRQATATDGWPAGRQPPPGGAAKASTLAVRRVRQADISHIIALDARVTGLAKPDYWQDIFERYGRRRLGERMFLVAEPAAADGRAPILGFIVGEVRAWEFGSAPCGWVLALSVETRARLSGTGRMLLDALSAEFDKAGVSKMRTMVARDNQLHLLFFRSEGMMAGPYIQLEKDLT